MEIQEIFLNRVGRLRSGWRLGIFAVLLIIGIKLSVALAVTLFSLIFGASAESVLHGNWGFIVQGFILLVPATLIGWACGKFLEDLPPRALGWGFHSGWLKDLLLGSLVGAVSLLLATMIATLPGGLKFMLNAPVMFETVGRTLLASLPIFILAAAGEEAMFRGYPLQTMARSQLAWVAIIVTSIIFSWGHLDNPNAVPGFTFANTAIAGVWLAVAYLRTRSLWFPLGIHWAWNWTMGAVLGLPVSGIERLTPEPLWRATDFGPAWLTGGSYGIEGGAACTIALLVSTLFIWRTRLVSPTEEMRRLTDQENPKQTPPGLIPNYPLEPLPKPISNRQD
ncbi:MAG: protease family protein [Acidobacteriota bacterium]|jgi:membrane protease YdiL (CAAX protease family)|nr:protease family protein [Acidobacteriota bacterium]